MYTIIIINFAFRIFKSFLKIIGTFFLLKILVMLFLFSLKNFPGKFKEQKYCMSIHFVYRGDTVTVGLKYCQYSLLKSVGAQG